MDINLTRQMQTVERLRDALKREVQKLEQMIHGATPPFADRDDSSRCKPESPRKRSASVTPFSAERS